MHKSATENFLPPLLELFLLQQIWYFCNLKPCSEIHFVSLSLYGKNVFFRLLSEPLSWRKALNCWFNGKTVLLSEESEKILKNFVICQRDEKTLLCNINTQNIGKKSGLGHKIFFFFLFVHTNNPVTFQQCIWEFTWFLSCWFKRTFG